jgi:hypothetical protein
MSSPRPGGKDRPKHRLPDGTADLRGPIFDSVGVPKAQIGQIPSNRDGIGFWSHHIDEWIAKGGWALTTEQGFMNITEQLRSQYKEAADLWDTYKARHDAFRGHVKNDVASLEAQARAIATASQKINKAFSDVVSTLNSTDMAQAISNAERLSSALTSLNQLQAHKIMFATVDSQKDNGQ